MSLSILYSEITKKNFISLFIWILYLNFLFYNYKNKYNKYIFDYTYIIYFKLYKSKISNNLDNVSFE